MPTYAFSFLLLLLTFLMGCSKDNEGRDNTGMRKGNSDTFSNIPGGSSTGSEAYGMASDDILEVLRHNGMEATGQALQSSGLTERLKQKTGITFFAPSDVAFNRFENSQKLNKELLKELLLNHAVNGIIKPEDLINGRHLTTLSGKQLIINTQQNKLRINNAAIVDTHLAMNNGIIYKINDVIRTN